MMLAQSSDLAECQTIWQTVVAGPFAIDVVNY